ncbi:helix-turn-helix transcriptional regulator [Gluconacetobacter diazotrophicus]|uniref:Helix-turn-helix transcriptional regulator n=1 Tax=Gluconacetobacter diazotrophicus TaxID=33996 RepID=A0A7W4FBR7_GLUDI|nr:DUF1870 family protein [Gluconacetobacter diazotrophicus]MBB2154806.1 helix-turn-helix transcriptional regulator [Gluconacetobacter diazotrophicus]
MSNIPPDPGAIRAARKDAHLTQAEAAEVVSVSLATWRRWEAGSHPMPSGLFDLFLIVTKPGHASSRMTTAAAEDIRQRLDALIRDAIACRRQVARHTSDVEA